MLKKVKLCLRTKNKCVYFEFHKKNYRDLAYVIYCDKFQMHDKCELIICLYEVEVSLCLTVNLEQCYLLSIFNM